MPAWNATQPKVGDHLTNCGHLGAKGTGPLHFYRATGVTIDCPCGRGQPVDWIILCGTCDAKAADCGAEAIPPRGCTRWTDDLPIIEAGN